MFQFLMKGMLRDRHRSLLPSIVVALGVFLTVFMFTYMKGVFSDALNNSALYQSGHVKIMSRAYMAEADVIPNDLALDHGREFMAGLREQYPGLSWAERMRFGGLLDAFDENRETRAQVGVGGIAIDFLSPDSADRNRLHLQTGLTAGNLPRKSGDLLITSTLAEQMDLGVGDEVTLIGATVNGSMSLQNFRISGLIHFGVGPMDRSLILADLEDVRRMLDMGDWTSEVLGYFPTPYYDDVLATSLVTKFNVAHSDTTDPYGPVMVNLLDDAGMRDYYSYAEKAGSIMSTIMIFAMGIVLWNTGLMGAIRRYGEMGLRLAVGESKGHVYRSLILESLGVAVAGTFLGTALGLGAGYWLQEVGLDISGMMKDVELLMPTILRARITPTAFYIGVFPGVIATLIGSGLSGLRIFSRDTASLFKELET